MRWNTSACQSLAHSDWEKIECRHKFTHDTMRRMAWTMEILTVCSCNECWNFRRFEPTAVFSASIVQGFVTDISSKQGCQAERAFPASITAVMNTNLGHRRFWQDLLVAKQHTKEGTKLGKDWKCFLQKSEMITMTSSLQASLARIANTMANAANEGHFTYFYSWLNSS